MEESLFYECQFLYNSNRYCAEISLAKLVYWVLDSQEL